MATYDIGDIIRVSASFKNSASTLIDPTSASVIYKNPSGSSTSLVYGTDAVLEKDATGIYHADVTINQAGRWFIRWSSSGTGQATEESYFDIRSRKVT